MEVRNLIATGCFTILALKIFTLHLDGILEISMGQLIVIRIPGVRGLEN